MYANISDSPELIKQELLAFMDEHIYPNEARYHEELNALPDRFGRVPRMDELKPKATYDGLWHLFVPHAHGGLM